MQKISKASNDWRVDERVPRFEAWARRLSHDELIETFAQLLAAHLIARKNHRDKERTWNAKEGDLTDRLLTYQNIIELFECVQTDQRDQRSEGGKSKSKDKQAAKAGALALWKERYVGKHPELRTVDQFATEVMKRWPMLTSHKVICGWSSKWTKQVRAGQIPAC